MKARRKLFSHKDPFDTAGTERLFADAMRENCLFHYKHSETYRMICDGKGFDPSSVKEYSDVERIPFIPTLFFKKHVTYSLPKYRLPARATSSGTGGTKSEVGFTLGDLLLMLKMVIKASKLRSLFSAKPCHYILFGYKPHRTNQMAVTKTALAATLYAPALSRTYALKYSGGRYSPDLEGVLAAIIKHSGSRFPVRFMGFPSYTYFLMKMMNERDIRLTMPKGSRILLGGGWKQFYAEKVDKSEFYALAEKVLGIKECDIVEFFGAVEHPVLYCDCKNHHFHVPIYSRVIIRDPDSLAPLPFGLPGLVELMTPVVTGTPIQSVMTDDIGILYDGRLCGCGIESPFIELHGRIGMSDIKTCAAGAAEMLSKVDLQEMRS